MKYESSILKRLIDTYGVIGNPRYLSEIIKEFIVRGKELYPQLFTYQSDWLAHIDEFGLTPDYVVSYTGQQIYAPHTKERPVKRAILKGCTGYRDIDTGEILETFEEGRNLELVSVKMPVLTTIGKNLFGGELEYGDFNNSTGIPVNNSDRIIRTREYNRISPNKTYNLTVFNAMKTISSYYIHEYDNDFNYIKTTISNVFTTSDNTKYIKFRFRKHDNTPFSNEELMNLSCMIVEGNADSTSYEPFKSNILTVNEEVELRGIGDVRDTLDCLTGEVTERIGEIVLDGSEDEEWGKSYETTNAITFRLKLPNRYFYTSQWRNTGLKNDCGFEQVAWYYIYSDKVDKECYGVGDDNKIYIRILKSRLNSVDVNGFKSYLSKNPITVQYQLATESIKTVDLSIVDQDNQTVNKLSTFEGGTHFSTSSQGGSLQPTIIVDVVTDLEETLNLCSTDGNTM